MKPNIFTLSLRTTLASVLLLAMSISFSSCCSRNWYKNGEQDDVYATVRPAECDANVYVRNEDDDYMQYQETTVTDDTPYMPTIYTPPTVIYTPPPIFIPRPAPIFIPRQNTPVYDETTNNWGNTGTNGNPKGTWTSTANPNGVNTGTYNNNNGNGYNNNNGTNGYYNNGVYYYYPRIPKQQINTPKDNTRNGGANIPVMPNTTNVAGGQGGNDAGSGGSNIYNAEQREKVRVQERQNSSTIYNNTGSNSNTNTSRRESNSSNSNNSNSSNNSTTNTYRHTPSTSGEQRGTSMPRSGEGRTRTPR